MNEVLREIKELEEMLLDLRQQERDAISVNPYWFYKPSDGSISPEGQELLEKYLRPEDMPEGRLDCQMDVHESDADITLCAGGNQVGKSTVGAITGYVWVTGEVPEALEGKIPDSMLPHSWPQHVRVEGVDWPTMQKNVIPAFRYWAPKEYLENGEWDKSFSVQEQILTLSKDNKLVGTIEFMNNRQNVESHQGPPRHGMIYDEEPRFEIWKENLMRFTTAERIKILMAMTPTKGLSWVHDEIFLKQETGDSEFTIRAFALASITNKYANTKIIRKILGGQDSYQAVKMRLLGQFVSLSGLIYGSVFNRKVHVIKPFPINKDDFVVYRGLDPHLAKPTVCVELAVDREGNEYVVGVYQRAVDTGTVKEDLARRVKERDYRVAWTRCDRSADTTIRILGDRNIYRELKRGKNAIPALFVSEKYEGSIRAGVDQIKKLLKANKKTGKPRLHIFDTAECKLLINAMRTLERDRAQDEDIRGERDKINEGKHDTHACLRYIHQFPVRWIEPVEYVPEYEPDNPDINY
jgi:phage terminase large subunit-like protein